MGFFTSEYSTGRFFVDRFHCQDIKKKLLNLSSFTEKLLAVFSQLLQYFLAMLLKKNPQKYRLYILAK